MGCGKGAYVIVAEVVPGTGMDGVFFHLAQFSIESKLSAKGESPSTFVFGVIRQIFESEKGFDGGKVAIVPQFRNTTFATGQ